MMNNWNEEEDKILAMSVKTNGSLANAFKEASGITGRSVKSCSSRYYNVLKKDEHFLALYVRKKTLWDKISDKLVSWLMK